MKIPVKECTLCGALIRDQEDVILKHQQFHKATTARPVRRMLEDVIAPRRPPVLEEPSRRPAPMTPGMRAAAQRQRDRQGQQWAQDIGDAPGPPRVTSDPDEKPGPDDVNGLLYVPPEIRMNVCGSCGASLDNVGTDGHFCAPRRPEVFGDPNGMCSTDTLPRRRKIDTEAEPRAMYATPVRKVLGPQFGS